MTNNSGVNYGELLALISAIITAVTGAITTINKRKAADAALGTDLGRAKIQADITRVDQTYIQQAEAIRAELARAQELLRRHGIQL